MSNKFALVVTFSVSVTLAAASPKGEKREYLHFINSLENFIDEFLDVITKDYSTTQLTNRNTWPTLIEEILGFAPNSIVYSAMEVVESSMYAAVEYGVHALDKIVEENKNATKDEREFKLILYRSRDLLSYILVRLDVALDAANAVQMLAGPHISVLLNELLESMEEKRIEVQKALSYTEQILS